jgi:hypothetical protein
VGTTLGVTGATTLSGDVAITSATGSGSPATGALIVTGGVGVGEDLYVNGIVGVGSNLGVVGISTLGVVNASGNISSTVGFDLAGATPVAGDWRIAKAHVLPLGSPDGFLDIVFYNFDGTNWIFQTAIAGAF